jgi:hypothetical protein
MNNYIIITTINNYTEAIIKFSKNRNWKLIIVSDKKTPILKNNEGIKVLDIKWQNKNKYKYTEVCPYNHYSRKNIGYIYAITNGADNILDTDDDNIPYANWEKMFELTDKKLETIVGPKYVNVYGLFTEKKVWPRGFPLNNINKKGKIELRDGSSKQIGIIQGLANDDPDVDAIYRMIDGEKVQFQKRGPVVLDDSVYCPINSQNTLWHKDVFVYLYLPISVSFRFTDILRGYIAQKGIWAMKRNLAFIEPTVFQKRNKHDLMKDFIDEIECYVNVERVVNILDRITLTGVPRVDIKIIYQELCKNKIVKRSELSALDAWIKDISFMA